MKTYDWFYAENPNKALHTLKSSSQLMTVEFNPRDPVLLLSGLITGQVCYWDIRNSGKPVQTSHLYTSHRYANFHPQISNLPTFFRTSRSKINPCESFVEGKRHKEELNSFMTRRAQRVDNKSDKNFNFAVTVDKVQL